MFGFFPNSSKTQLRGQGIKLCLPEKANYVEWLSLRNRNKEFLTPFEPKWAAVDLTARSFSLRVKNARRAARQGTDYSFFIFDTGANGKKAPASILVGGITLSNVRYRAARHANIGYWLGKEYLGMNYMGRAMALCLDFAFNSLKLQRVHAASMPHNQSSINVLLKAGFEKEGFSREFLQIAGTYQDHNLYGLTARHYMTIKGN